MFAKKPKLNPVTLLECFKSGDLLYGLEQTEVGGAGQRAIYRKMLDERYPHFPYITVDRLNNFVLLYVLQPPSAEEEQGLAAPLRAYWQYIKNFKNRTQLPRYDFTNMLHESDEIILKKLCKAAFFLENAHIHFCLDGIDLKRVASLVVFNKQKQRYSLDQGFTSAELRFLYRHWNELKHKVTFYIKGEVVAAPWGAEWVYLKKTDAESVVLSLNKQYQEELTNKTNKSISNNPFSFLPPSPAAKIKLSGVDLNLEGYRPKATANELQAKKLDFPESVTPTQFK